MDLSISVSKRYSTGSPCKNGHVSERRMADNRCVQCLKDTRARAPIEHKKNRQKRNKRWLESTKEMRQERAKKLQEDSKLKTCSWCKVEKPKDKFGPDERIKDGLHAVCRACVNARQLEPKRKQRQTPEGKLLSRHRQLKCLYGITLDDFNVMLKEQNDRCAICHTNVPGGPGSPGSFAVDHDHTTGKVRGLLCARCNRNLAIVENVEFNRSANRYLAHYGVTQ